MMGGSLEATALQRMLYDALDQSDDIVLMLEETSSDAEPLVIISANDAFCRTTGYDHAELIGRPFCSLAAADADSSRFAEMVRAAHTRKSFRSELLCSRKNGARFWFGVHLMPVREAEPPCFAILGRDITESLAARQQQAAVQGLLAKVFLCVKAPVAIVSDTGIVQMTNPALDELLNHAPGTLVGTLSINFVAPAARAAALAARQCQLEDGRDYTIPTRLLRTDGTEIAADITSTAVQRDDLRRVRIITVLPASGPASMVATAAAVPFKVLVAGKIKMIGLEEVKQTLGARWEAVAARAMDSAEHVIRRHCGARDTFSRTTDGGFLICFADASEEEATFRAAALGREIRARLVGEGESEQAASVSTVAASVSVPDVPGQSADALAAIIGERLNAQLAQIEVKARQTLDAALHTTACRIEPVRNSRTRKIVAQYAKLPRDLEGRLHAAYSALSMKERQNFDFDRLVLGIAAQQAVAQIATGAPLLTMVNLDFDVFLDRRRADRYLAACEALDTRLRQRLVVVLSGIPKNFPKSRMLECVVRLRPFCHRIGFQSDSMEAPSVDGSLLSGAIVVLPEERLATRGAVDPEKLGRLIVAMHARQAHVLLRRVRTWDDLQLLAGIAIDLVSAIEDERDAESTIG
jgi:PAS domain S-box-containing protein